MSVLNMSLSRLITIGFPKIMQFSYPGKNYICSSIYNYVTETGRYFTIMDPTTGYATNITWSIDSEYAANTENKRVSMAVDLITRGINQLENVILGARNNIIDFNANDDVELTELE